MKSLIKFVAFVFCVVFLLQGLTLAEERSYVLYVSNRNDKPSGIIDVLHPTLPPNVVASLAEIEAWLAPIFSSFPPAGGASVYIYGEGPPELYSPVPADGLLSFKAHPGETIIISHPALLPLTASLPDNYVANSTIYMHANLIELVFQSGIPLQIQPGIRMKFKEARKAPPLKAVTSTMPALPTTTTTLPGKFRLPFRKAF